MLYSNFQLNSSVRYTLSLYTEEFQSVLHMQEIKILLIVLCNNNWYTPWCSETRSSLVFLKVLSWTCDNCVHLLVNVTQIIQPLTNIALSNRPHTFLHLRVLYEDGETAITRNTLLGPKSHWRWRRYVLSKRRDMLNYPLHSGTSQNVRIQPPPPQKSIPLESCILTPWPQNWTCIIRKAESVPRSKHTPSRL
jgi:hypothetical protein